MNNKVLPRTAVSPYINRRNGYMSSAHYTKEIPLEDALNGLLNPDKAYAKELYGIISNKSIIAGFLENFLRKFPALLDVKVIGLKGFGASAMAFETERNKIMKLAYKNHYPNNRPVADFDVPVLYSGNSKDYFYYYEKKADVLPVIPDELRGKYEALEKSIWAQGYDLVDFRPSQAGFISGENKFYLVDPQCARLKPAARVAQGVKDLFNLICQGSKRGV